MEGTCDGWTKFSRHVLGIPLEDVEIVSISVSSGYRATWSGPASNQTVTCTNRSAVASISDGLSRNRPFTVSCDGRQWRHARCKARAELALCVDCTPNGEGCLSFTGVLVSPCRQGGTSEVYYSVVHAKMQQRVLYPTLTDISVTTSEHSMIVSVDANKDGLVFCAAYRSGSVLLKDVNRVRRDGTGGILTLPSQGPQGTTAAELTIQGLSPSTRYDVYCGTEDFRGNAMPLASVVDTRTIVETACCRRLVLVSNISSVFEYPPALASSASTEVVFRFQLNSVPLAPVTISVTLVAQVCSIGPSSAASAVPRQFLFTNTSRSMTGSFVVRGSAGCYGLSVVAANNQYQSAFQRLTISAPTEGLNPPVVTNAMFSNDGRKLFVQLDTDSDLGATVIANYDKSFACSALIHFEGIGNSKCSWQEASLLVVTLVYSDSTYVRPLDILTLLGGKLKTRCPPDETCLSFRFNVRSQVPIREPTSAIYPLAALSSSAQVLSPCMALVLDPRQSKYKGGAGRPWDSVSWAVTGSGANLTAVAGFLGGYTTNTMRTIHIPSSLIRTGSVTYRITVKNFLGRSSVASVRVNVVEVVVAEATIFGPVLRKMYVWQPLSLFALADFVPCLTNLSASNTSQLLYDWTAYEGLNYVPSLVTISNDPRAFKLPSYSLVLFSTYTFVVRVYTADVDVSVSDAVTYQVKVRTERSGPVAVIKGGDFFIVSSTDSLELDGSLSGDRDLPNSPLTTLQWFCMETAPSYGSACNVDFSADKVQKIKASDMLKDTVAIEEHIYVITLRVTAYDGLTAETDATVVVTADTLPSVVLSPVAEKYNPLTDITIGADISYPSPFTARWNCSSIDLDSVATTKIVRQVQGATLVTFQLGIRADSLFPGRKYSFQLLAKISSDDAFRTIAHQSIIMNEAPSGGYVESHPMAGLALNTTFTIRADGWDDDVDDYPLTFVLLSFTEDSTKAKTLKSATELPYVKSVLPQGLAAMDYAVTCLAIVMDIYGSEGRANITVTVEPLPSELLESALTSQLEDAFLSFNADGVTAIDNSATEALNTAQCGQAPDCEALNRLPCKSTAETCGPCKSSVFIGIEGDSNSMCYQHDNARRALSIVHGSGDSCNPGDICIGGTCVDGLCTKATKSCPSNCTDHGVCSYYDVRGRPLKTGELCNLSDTYCVARCDCDDGYFTHDCSSSQVQFDEELQLRENMCVALYEAMKLQDPSSDILSGRARLVDDLLLDASVVTSTALSHCLGVISDSIFNDTALLTAPSVSNAMMAALSRVVVLADMLPAEALRDIYHAIIILMDVRLEQLPVEHTGMSDIAANIRWVTSKHTGSDMKGHMLTGPLSAFEAELDDVDPVAVLFRSDGYNDATSYGIALMQSNVLLWLRGAENATGGAVHVKVNDYSQTYLTRPSVTINIPNYRPTNYIQDKAETGVVECRMSRDRSVFNVTVNCSATDNMPFSSHDVECPGDKVVKVPYACPVFSATPHCWTFEGTMFAAGSTCTVEEFSPLHVACVCQMEPSWDSKRGRRRLESAAPVWAVGVVPVLVEAVSSFERFSLLSASHEETDNTFSSIVVVSFTFVLSALCFSLGGLFLAGRSEAVATRHMPKDMSVAGFFAAALPVQFSDMSWTSRFADKLKETHSVAGLFREEDSWLKFTRFIALFVAVAFVNTVWSLFQLTDEYVDCDSHGQKSSCLSQRRGEFSFENGKSICEWSESSRSCYYKQPSADVVTVLLMAMLVLVTTIPLNAAVTLCLTEIHHFHVFRRRYGIERIKDYPWKSGKMHLTHDDADQCVVHRDHNRKPAEIALRNWESTKSKLSCYGRLQLFRRRFDEASPSSEVSEVMNIGAGSRECKKRAFWQRRSVPRGGAALADSRIWTSRLVALARSDAKAIAVDVDSIEEDDYKQIAALQHFLVNACVDWKQSLARLHLTASGMFDSRRRQSKFKYWCACAFLFAFLFTAACVVYIYGSTFDFGVARLWLIVGIVAVVQKLLIVDLAYILIIHIGVAAVLRFDIIRMHHRLRDHGERIMDRAFTRSTVQHRRIHSFNAATRWARHNPQYPFSRLLLQLTDFDIPTTYAHQPPFSSMMCMVLMTPFLALSLLPLCWHDVIVEAAIAGSLGCALVGAFNLARISIAIPVVLAGAIVLIVFSIVYYDCKANGVQSMSSRQAKYQPSEAEDDMEVPMRTVKHKAIASSGQIGRDIVAPLAPFQESAGNDLHSQDPFASVAPPPLQENEEPMQSLGTQNPICSLANIAEAAAHVLDSSSSDEGALGSSPRRADERSQSPHFMESTGA